MGLSRRKFLKTSVLGIIGSGTISRAKGLNVREQEASEVPKIKEYRTLGRTDFKVSDISAGVTTDVSLLNALLDSGINYIDTSESYGGGRIEETVGEAIRNRNRKSLFITTKTVDHSSTRRFSKDDVTKEGFLRRIRRSLERLQTDYIDCIMFADVKTVDSYKQEGFHSAVKQLKEEGRVKYVGISYHGFEWQEDRKETMDKILLTAAEDGRFDVMLLVYNFLKQDISEQVLRVCREKNIGTTLMKTEPARLYYGVKQWIEDQEKKGEEVEEGVRKTYSELKEKLDKGQGFYKEYNLKTLAEIRDAAIRFVLSNPDVNTACISFRNYDDLNDYIRLSGSRLATNDKALLSAYSQNFGSLYCRHACGLCESECPHKVPVNAIMRYDHYFEAQGREKYAMKNYAALPTAKADKCLSCYGPCQNACPYGVLVQGLLIHAHQIMTLS
jgi:aryl-alcohol dehydrogenase-like predicted oxidoreductase